MRKSKKIFLLAWILGFFIIIAWKNLDAQIKKQNLSQLFSQVEDVNIGPRVKSSDCNISGAFPDKDCTPGAVFSGANIAKICVPGYTKTVRSVGTDLKRQIYQAYNLSYPSPRGAFEVDHLIPLALGGNNDSANLWPEANADPKTSLGYKEKDIVEIYLQEEVCAGRVNLTSAQTEIADDWTVIYNNLSPERIKEIKTKYTNWSN